MSTKDALHSGDPILELRNVSKSFGPVNVIKDVSVGVYPGQVQALRMWWDQTAGFDRTQGLNVATNLLQAPPNVKAIFAENDEMALGALEALGDKAGKDVMVVGFDGTEDGLAAVEDGRMVATIAQQPGELGAKAVEEAAKLLDGETAESEVPVEVVTVTKENVGEFK